MIAKLIPSTHENVPYTSLSCENFRCFGTQFSLNELGKYNFIIGPNNVGKTALLEAIRLLDDMETSAFEMRGALDFTDFFNDPGKPVKLVGKMPGHRQKEMTLSLSRGDLTASLFGKQAVVLKSGSLKIVYKDEHGIEYPSTFSPPEPGEKARLISGGGNLSNRTIQEHLKSYLDQLNNPYLLEGLRLLEPQIKTLSIENVHGNQLIYTTLFSGKTIPIRLMGDGINHLLLTLATLLEETHSVILWDEIEHSYYPGFLEKLWRLIVSKELGKGRQFFVVTHDHAFLKQAFFRLEQARIYELYRDTAGTPQVREN